MNELMRKRMNECMNDIIKKLLLIIKKKKKNIRKMKDYGRVQD